MCRERKVRFCTFSAASSFSLTRWKATSSWWFGPVHRRGEARSLPNSRRVSVLAPTLSTAAARWWFRTSRRGQETTPNTLVGDPGSTWWRDESKRQPMPWKMKRDMKLVGKDYARNTEHVHACRKAHMTYHLKNQTSCHCLSD